MTLGAFGLLREARKLPAERDAETGNQVSD